MHIRKLNFALAIVLPITFWQCSHTVAPAGEDVRELTALEKRVVAAENAFGFTYFAEQIRASSSDNVFVSPLSVSMALTLAARGAEGETWDAMAGTLGYTGMSKQELGETAGSLLALLLNGDPRVTFEVANAVFHQNGMAFEASYLQAARDAFRAKVDPLDFQQPAASAQAVNAWIDAATRGVIDKLIDAGDIDPNTVMFLLSAIYFNGRWQFEFDKDATSQQQFATESGASVAVPMMGLTGTLAYASREGVQAVRLPYGSGRFAMVVLLPEPGQSARSVAENLNSEAWQDWQKQLREMEVELRMPRFSLAFEAELNDVLAKLGMGVAFSDQADFSGMYAPGGLYIDQVKHKAFIEVDERGTEAAAVTSVEIGVTSLPNRQTVRIDRPFVFAIVDTHSEAVLFLGKVADPTG